MARFVATTAVSLVAMISVGARFGMGVEGAMLAIVLSPLFAGWATKFE